MEQKVSKASDHVKPCNIAQSEAHNRRDTEYIKSLNPAKLYIRTELSHRNESYVSPEMEGKTLQQHYDFIKVMVKDKTKRSMQEKDVLLKNGKTRKGASPIRESVVNIKECTTMEDLLRYVREVERRKGIHALQIHIHKDEGYFENPDDPSTWKPNYHAHIIWDWMDHSTGKSWKLNEKDMSEMQTLVAKTLGMERGTAKAETHLDHLERNDYILQKQRNEMESIAKAKAVAETQTAELKEECEHLEEEVEQAKHRKEEAEKDAKAAELFKELANIAEVELPFPKFKVDELITNTQNTINDELSTPIKLMQQKEWKQERQKNIKQALTDLQTNLGVAKGEYVEEIKSHCKEIFRYYREELKKLINENEKLQKENKTLYANNSSLQKENRQLEDKISKIDANAIEKLSKEKDAEYDKLKSQYNNLVDDYNAMKERDNLFKRFAEWLAKHPEIQEIMNITQQKEFEEKWKKAKIELREKCITNAQTEIQNFGKSGQNDYTDSDQISCVLCGIIAIADKLGIDATLESGCKRATQELLDGVYWFNYRQMQKDMAT
ncbi:MAG: hypothetical protein Q4E26_00640, partial [Prevotellaceae bacterium]|nr:hypothetical protein [Prevotellaceae bacterium]